MGKPPQYANTLNPYWLSYEVQRHLQLAKAVLVNHGITRVRTVVEIDHIEKFSLLVSFPPIPTCITRHPYGGSHEPIPRDVDLIGVHDYDGSNRNIIMQPVRDIIDEVCRMFSLSEAPSDVSDEEGRLLYDKGQSQR